MASDLIWSLFILHVYIRCNKGCGDIKFEIGKYYEHTTGRKLSILCEVETYYHGKCLLGETDLGELVPVGTTEEYAVNYHEISENQFKIEK